MRSTIVFLVSVVAAVDDNSMLQVEVDASAEMGFAIENIEHQILELEIPGKANQLAINAMMKTLHGSTKLDEADRKVLQHIIDTLEDPILKNLRAEKQSKEGAFQALVNEVGYCNSAGVENDQQKNETSIEARENHTDCRQVQSELQANETRICGVATTQMTAAVELDCPFGGYDPVTMDVLSHPDGDKLVTEYEEALKVLKFKYQRHQNVLEPAIVACQDAQGESADEDEECDTHQNKFERAFCEWRYARLGMCNRRSTCVTNVTDYFSNEFRSDAMALSRERVHTACLINHVICLIEKLLLPQPVTDIHACDGVGTDVTTCEAEYGNNFGDLPAEESCDIEAVSPYPGHVDWAGEQYSSMPTLKEGYDVTNEYRDPNGCPYGHP